MEKMQRTKKIDPKTPVVSSQKKIFGTNTLQINGDDASCLIGSILEKGISDSKQTSKPFSPIPPPRPTVLPFPVARHRSHGPHWNPLDSLKTDHNCVGGEDDEEEDEFVNSNSISSFANPVERKQKKGLDFSKWKELIRGDSSNTTKEGEEDKSNIGKTEKQKKNVGGAFRMTEKNISSDLSIAVVPMEVDDEEHSDSSSFDSVIPKVPIKASASTMISSYISTDSRNEQGSVSLESEIDAENRAQLARMSPEEIAEAQAEIMEKMDPALLNLLRKRGRDKLKKQTYSSPKVARNDEVHNAQSEIQSNNANTSLGLEHDNSQMTTSCPAKDKNNRLNNNSPHNSASTTGTLWEEWSKRVEAVRNLRFSLVGSVVEDDFVSTFDTGELSLHKGPNADNAAERDFLRTDGDPGAAGYTIKEAVALSRSAVPGQRALALHLLRTVLGKAIQNICLKQVGEFVNNDNKVGKDVDWVAVWAYALGPEPELVLALRICLDDNNNSVVLACAKLIDCILTCNLNEDVFDISERGAIHGMDCFTAPVFRSKPEIDVGFLRGGYWKYNTKPSNILTFTEDTVDDETEGKHTVQDDVVVAGQDVAAGLVRMGVLPRICYLLETEPTAALQECLISMLVAIARHSPTCGSAIMKCRRLVHTVVHRFNANSSAEICSSQIRSVRLLKVLALSDKKNCQELLKGGILEAMTWHLYRFTSSIEQWIKLGKEKCKLSSSLMVEQLQLLKVCVQIEYPIFNFSDIFPALCLWLNPPTFEKLVENNVISEFACVSKEAYLVLEALAGTLPNFYSQKIGSNQILEHTGNDMGSWSWSFVGPMVDLAMKWISLASRLFDWESGLKVNLDFRGLSTASFLWVYSAVFHMLSRVLDKLKPEDTISLNESEGYLPWLPEFIPKIGLQIIRNGLLSFSVSREGEYGANFAGCSSFTEKLCCFRLQGEYESSLASVCCLHGIVRVAVSLDKLIQLAKAGMHSFPSQGSNPSIEESILESGILKGSLVEFRCLLNAFMKLVASEWHLVQSIEMFGRGGPSPGMGIGWGASGGGFWSKSVLLSQTDARLLSHLVNICQIVPAREQLGDEELPFMMEVINTALGMCLTAGPRDKIVIEKALDILLQVPALKYLDLCVQRFLQLNRRIKSFAWEYKETDYIQFNIILTSHFRKRWLSVKTTSKTMDGNSFFLGTSKSGVGFMETIHEDVETPNMTSKDQSCSYMIVEWAHQRLPLPIHWFLSPISTIVDHKSSHPGGASSSQNLFQDSADVLEVAKCGLFFLLGIEAMSTFLPGDAPSPIRSVPLVWKLHSLSVILLVGMGVLEEEKSSDIYESLQEIYGQFLDEGRLGKSSEPILDRQVNLFSVESGKNKNMESLRFQSEIHESYSTFIETLVEQYGAVSYGNLVYGRQVAVYLHRCVEAPVRLAAWNALSNAHVLELLPPLEKCFTAAAGYLEPIEDNIDILEAYVKSWISGALDRAVIRGSAAFTLVLHHVSSFIFLSGASDDLSLQNKLVKTLLRDYSQKQNHEGMMLALVQYNKPSTSPNGQKENLLLQKSDIEQRFNILKDACDRNSSLLIEVEKLRSAIEKEQHRSKTSM
ncbi:LOW QUALITY PROTEIN: transcriptional elongation regulator MINIYO [Carica papaya]|uniref:LOW QUALITY PROTEIN: transcriptional elongation regulator MINIYO n=1 Tax=Carica papaya TaxID=3649 RepID=UPI000B8C7D8C|nr:LOW QUALITY PROTEIN: transcriptional elongation regulator MINIYO [Carica papaya]